MGDPPRVATDSLHGSVYVVNEEEFWAKKKADSFVRSCVNLRKSIYAGYRKLKKAEDEGC